jgi:hypothetical protein
MSSKIIEIPEATTPLEDDSNSNIPTKKSRGRVAKEKQVSNNSSGRPRRTESVGSDSAQISIGAIILKEIPISFKFFRYH